MINCIFENNTISCKHWTQFFNVCWIFRAHETDDTVLRSTCTVFSSSDTRMIPPIRRMNGTFSFNDDKVVFHTTKLSFYKNVRFPRCYAVSDVFLVTTTVEDIKFNRRCLLNWVGHITVSFWLSLIQTAAVSMKKNANALDGLSEKWNVKLPLLSLRDYCSRMVRRIRRRSTNSQPKAKNWRFRRIL